jgi:hypothetical protein
LQRCHCQHQTDQGCCQPGGGKYVHSGRIILVWLGVVATRLQGKPARPTLGGDEAHARHRRSGTL